METLPNTLPPLTTARLHLRSMRADDAEALFAVYGDPEVMRYAGDGPFARPAMVEEMLESVGRLLAAGRSLEWGIVEKRTGALIGTCGLHTLQPERLTAEVGCLLARAFWGQGHMREALTRVMEHAETTLGLTGLRADIDAPNVRSIRLFRSPGFAHVRDTLYEHAFTPQIGPSFR